jgi:hypothetical protein
MVDMLTYSVDIFFFSTETGTNGVHLNATQKQLTHWLTKFVVLKLMYVVNYPEACVGEIAGRNFIRFFACPDLGIFIRLPRCLHLKFGMIVHWIGHDRLLLLHLIFAALMLEKERK